MPQFLEEFKRFHEVASEFCTAVDSAQSTDRETLVLRIYRLLPLLIGRAVNLSPIESSDDQTDHKKARISQEQWGELYSLLKEKLGDWDLYSQVFDPTKDRDAIYGSLADDIADIYRDLKEGLDLHSSDIVSSNDILWEWRFGFYSHWGHHAINALRTIHFLLGPTLS